MPIKYVYVVYRIEEIKGQVFFGTLKKSSTIALKRSFNRQKIYNGKHQNRKGNYSKNSPLPI